MDVGNVHQSVAQGGDHEGGAGGERRGAAGEAAGGRHPAHGPGHRAEARADLEAVERAAGRGVADQRRRGGHGGGEDGERERGPHVAGAEGGGGLARHRGSGGTILISS